MIKRSGQTKKEIVRCVKLVRTVTQPPKQSSAEIAVLFEFTCPQNHLCNKLKLGPMVAKDAIDTVVKIDKGGYLGGRNPYTKTSVAIYLVSRKATNEPTLDKISEGASTTPATLRNSLRQLKPNIWDVVPERLRKSPDLEALIDKI